MKIVPLHGKKAMGRVALVDDGDYELVMQYKWYVWERTSRGTREGPYAIAAITRRRKTINLKMHKFLTGYARTDHKDGNGLNNQRSNLRPATDAQNMANKRKKAKGTSTYKGVSLDKRCGTWHAYIGVGRKTVNLGGFKNEQEAAKAYDRAACAAYGEYAWLNFPADHEACACSSLSLRDQICSKADLS